MRENFTHVITHYTLLNQVHPDVRLLRPLLLHRCADHGTYTGPHASADIDGRTDIGTDIRSHSGTDAGPDPGPDASSYPGTDTSSYTGPDAGPNPGSDPGTDTSPDARSGRQMQ